jgi:hypothetical protein
MPTVLIVDADRTVQFADVQADYTSRTDRWRGSAATHRLSSQRTLG